MKRASHIRRQFLGLLPESLALMILSILTLGILLPYWAYWSVLLQ